MDDRHRPLSLVRLPIPTGSPQRLTGPHSRVMAAWLWVAAAGGLTGCESLGLAKKFKNPVCPPPPTRVANLVDDSDSEYAEEQSAQDEGVAWVSATEDGGKPVALPNGEVAATVNGAPIFMDDVLQPFAVGLAREAQHRSPEEMRQIRRELAAKHIKHHIEREVLVQSLRVKLKDDQFKGLSEHLDKEWAVEELDMMKKAKVNTRAELDASLRKSGTSLNQMKATFKNQKMAQQYLATKAVSRDKPSRAELLVWYNDHITDYETPAKVRWRQILIKSSEFGSERRAAEFANDLVLDLREGLREFDEAARKHSAGPTATTGGDWDWTTEGSVSWKEVDKVLFTLEPGEISDPIETSAGWQIVEVIERVDAGRVPFDDVHDAIADAMARDKFRTTVDSLLTELVSQAEVKLLFDEAPAAAPAPKREVVPAKREAVEEEPAAPRKRVMIRELPAS